MVTIWSIFSNLQTEKQEYRLFQSLFELTAAGRGHCDTWLVPLMGQPVGSILRLHAAGYSSAVNAKCNPLISMLILPSD